MATSFEVAILAHDSLISCEKLRGNFMEYETILSYTKLKIDPSLVFVNCIHRCLLLDPLNLYIRVYAKTVNMLLHNQRSSLRFHTTSSDLSVMWQEMSRGFLLHFTWTKIQNANSSPMITRAEVPTNNSEWFVDLGASHSVTCDLTNLSFHDHYENGEDILIGDRFDTHYFSSYLARCKEFSLIHCSVSTLNSKELDFRFQIFPNEIPNLFNSFLSFLLSYCGGMPSTRLI